MSTLKEAQQMAKAKLAQAGLADVYAKEGGILVVKGKQGDAVKVEVALDEYAVLGVKGKFPQLGNGVQVITTLLLLVVGFGGYLPYPILSAVLLGQLIAFIWFQPKIKQLENEVKGILEKTPTN